MSAELPACHPESAAERHWEEIWTCTDTAGPTPGWALLPGILHPLPKKSTNETLWHGEQCVMRHSSCSIFRFYVQYYVEVACVWLIWLFLACVSLSPSLRWSTSCAPAQTHLDRPCAICGPARTSCSLTCSICPSSCLVSTILQKSLPKIYTHKHNGDVKQETGKQEKMN